MKNSKKAPKRPNKPNKGASKKVSGAPQKMTLPNKLTIFRIALIPFFIYFLLSGQKYIGLTVFCVASITDWLDGYIARKYDLVSDFGKFADPLADKLLVISAMVCFVEMGSLPAWFVILIITREFTVTGLRLVALQKNDEVVSAGVGGKIKTVLQILAVILMLLELPVVLMGLTVGQVAMYVCLVATIWTGLQYMYKIKI